MITAKTRVKDILKSSKYDVDKMSNDFMSKLDEYVKETVLKAAKRAQLNNRKTVMGRDI